MPLCQSIPQQRQHHIRGHIIGHKGLSDAAGQNEPQLAVDHFFILSHQAQQQFSGRQIAVDIGKIGF